MDSETRLAIFQGTNIRKVIYKNEWWFSVVDVVGVLTDSANSRDYWFKMKIRVKNEDGAELSTNCRQLKLLSTDGKKYLTDCANTEGIFRIIQSIPSPKAEPFKKWLARLRFVIARSMARGNLSSLSFRPHSAVAQGKLRGGIL